MFKLNLEHFFLSNIIEELNFIIGRLFKMAKFLFKEKSGLAIEPSKSHFYVIYFILFMAFIFMMNEASTYLVQWYQSVTALSAGYHYIEYVHFNSSFYMETSLLIVSVVYLVILGMTIYSFIRRENIYKRIALLLFSLMPFLFIGYHYQNVDDFMYKPISKLYNLASKEKNFVNSDVGMRFRKALIENDYSTLKSISNNLTSLMGVPSKLLEEKEVIVNVIPLPELKASFVKIKKEFTSYSEYKEFYTQSLDVFQKSDLKTKPEFVLLMSMLILPENDYTIFLQNYY